MTLPSFGIGPAPDGALPVDHLFADAEHTMLVGEYPPTLLLPLGADVMEVVAQWNTTMTHAQESTEIVVAAAEYRIIVPAGPDQTLIVEAVDTAQEPPEDEE